VLRVGRSQERNPFFVVNRIGWKLDGNAARLEVRLEDGNDGVGIEGIVA
jgi:hypothetical protein